jgi:hypothetical protein
MWCKHCRQDVPALSLTDREYCCPRCGEAICVSAHQAALDGSQADDAQENSSASSTIGGVGRPPSYDGWEVEEKLRHIYRTLKAGRVSLGDTSAAHRREASRFDLPHADAPAWHAAADRPAERKRKVESGHRGALQGVFTWLVLSLGTTSFVCGGILLGWSLATGRQELWNIGLPAALAGQVALLIGLVLQLDRLWRENREAAAKLDDVDNQLHDLKTTTTLLGSGQSSAASTFYSHFAGGAGPQLLLTDLKSQLDLLAMKIAQSER